MKRVLIVALLVAFCAVAFGSTVIAKINDDGTVTVDQPAAKFPAKKLKEGQKKQPPVTFNHKKHGAEGCVGCHHTQPDLKEGGDAKSCFSDGCHGPEAEDKKVDTYSMIHDKKGGKCLKCHNEKKADGAPTKCKDCHKK